MNIFYLDENPQKAAEMLIDKHVVKMVLETAQLLSTAHRVLDGEHGYKMSANNRRLQTWTMSDPEVDAKLYKATHFNHPCSIWARESLENYDWLYEYFEALSKEYTKRFGKTHLSWAKLGDILAIPPQNALLEPFTEPPQAMPAEYHVEGDSIEAYHKYYQAEKLQLGTQKDFARYVELSGRVPEDKLPF